MHIGAQPVPPSLVHRWLEHFPHHQYDTDYGLTESVGPGCVHLGMENVHKVGAIGKPGYQWEAKIVGESGEPVAPGEVGELAVKGPGVMKCYYSDPEATAAVLKDGWLLTGDMARKDEDGFIYLVDRKKDVIITGGENIYPVQVEDFLHHHEAIKDVAVIGLPDERLGEIAAAIIQLKRGHDCTEQQILDFCAVTTPLQAPPPDHLRRGAPQRDRQDRQTQAPPQVPRGEPRRAGDHAVGNRRRPTGGGRRMEKKIVYFEEPGESNTEETLRLAVEEAGRRGIRKIVLASTRGDTARLAAARFAGTGVQLVVIPHQYGFTQSQRFPAGVGRGLGAARGTACTSAPCSSTPTASMARERPKPWP